MSFSHLDAICLSIMMADKSYQPAAISQGGHKGRPYALIAES
jgi:hypothetical protein